MLEHRLLNDGEAYNLWHKFASEIGIKTLKEVYGEYWPRKPVLGEFVYQWLYRGKELIAWTSIREDQLEPVFWALLGVFPKYQNKGFARKVFDLTIEKGFDLFPRTEWVFVEISKKNPRFFEYMKRQNCRWIQVGDISIPDPGYEIFGLKRGMKEELNG